VTDSDREIPLAGGNVSTVVRVGGTVRRVAGPHTPAVHAVLRHLEVAGFDAAPRALGYDRQGREVLSYVDGEVGHFPLGPEWTDDATLAAVARLLRRFHDAQAGFEPPADARWFFGAAPDAEVVCHHDAAPYNTVRRPDGTLALIDWDLAAPGSRLSDVAYAVWKWASLEAHATVDLGFPPGVDLGTRIRLFADAYGLSAAQRAGLLDAVRARMVAMIEGIERLAAEGRPAFVRLLREGHTEYPKQDLRQLARCRARWQEALA
jgi:hypothetical protein